MRAHVALRSRLFFFFQAEDGIRDWSVTGVQTCALPIYEDHVRARLGGAVARAVTSLDDAIDRGNRAAEAGADVIFVEAPQTDDEIQQIGRASCRERVATAVVAVSMKRE